MFDVKKIFTRTEVSHSLTPGNNIPHTRDVLTRTETYRILGGWRRYINPLGNLRKRVEKSTQGNLPLRRKVLWSVTQHSKSLGVYYKIIFILLSLIFILSVINNLIIINLFTAIMLPLSFIIEHMIHNKNKKEISPILEPPIFPKLKYSTGYPELDAIFTENSFEVERILIDGGMQLDELERLSALAWAMATNKEIEHKLVEGLFTVSTTVNVSPKAWELVKRATAIMSRGSAPRLLPHASSIADVLDVMEYAGIPVRIGEA